MRIDDCLRMEGKGDDEVESSLQTMADWRRWFNDVVRLVRELDLAMFIVVDG